MADVEKIEVRNSHDSMTMVVWEGEIKHEIPPQVKRVLPLHVAQLFMAQFPKYVQKYEESLIPTMPGFDMIWVANTTGSPLHPEKIKVLRRIEGKEELVEEVNGLCTPRELTFKINMGQYVSGPSEDRFAHAYPPMHIKLEPFKRYALSSPLANQILERDARCDEGFRGALVRVREPAEWEPNETYSLDELRAYAILMDPGYFTKDLMSNVFGAERHYALKGGGFDRNKVLEVRDELWKHVFARLIHDAYPRPSKDIFDKAIKEVREIKDKM